MSHLMPDHERKLPRPHHLNHWRIEHQGFGFADPKSVGVQLVFLDQVDIYHTRLQLLRTAPHKRIQLGLWISFTGNALCIKAR